MGCDYSKDLNPRAKDIKRSKQTAELESVKARISDALIAPSDEEHCEGQKQGRANRGRQPSLMQTKHDVTTKQLMAQTRANVIGINATFEGPFGVRKVTYCDFVASGKPIKFIEDYITENVLPFYANTHTTTSVSALQTSTFRHESREIIKHCVNATDEDVVIFTGSGATAAIHKLINAIGLRDERAKNTVVIISPYEHHSNILPWRTSGAKVERLKETEHGQIDVSDLRQRLENHVNSGKQLIVSLSAASNVTGIKTDVRLISEVAHEYGAFVFWDYACAGPYLEINLNPSLKGYIDAAFISAHKFLGGTGTPGILLAKKKLFTNEIPGGVGGGTVAYVSQDKAGYLSNIEEREEGGTPAIVESIRAGMAFQLKQSIGIHYIESVEDELCRKVFQMWKSNPNIHILGSHTAPRLPIFSILISHPESHKFLHHNFVSILLNDLYGIQARGGCACAGPYAMDLLCMDETMVDKFVYFLQDRVSDSGKVIKPIEIMKPGFARLNFSYYLDGDTVDFIIKAVDRIATDGWKLLPLYEYHEMEGSWRHRQHGAIKVAHLKDAKVVNGSLVFGQSQALQNEGNIRMEDMLTETEKIFEQAADLSKDLMLEDEEVSVDDKSMIWFLQPRTALLHLRAPTLKYMQTSSAELPFWVRQNTRMKARNRFVDALGQVGLTLEKTKGISRFTGSREDLTQDDLCAECADCQ